MGHRLIVIEGLDGSGKTTQLDLLNQELSGCQFITFPYYDTPSGHIISNYLEGAYQEVDSKVSAYTASCFYAVDRYTSFKTDWEKYLEASDVISSRYVSSNAIYQMAKLPRELWDEYLDWLYDLEYGKFKMPVPVKTIFLDMPLDISQRLLEKRYGGLEEKKDIHERDIGFLKRCNETAGYIGSREKWAVISCGENGEPLPKEVIHKKLMEQIREVREVLENA